MYLVYNPDHILQRSKLNKETLALLSYNPIIIKRKALVDYIRC
jgi:hypothetical protein